MAKALRRMFFRWAFKGCKAEDPAALAYAQKTMDSGLREDRLRIERALVLDYFAKGLRK